MWITRCGDALIPTPVNRVLGVRPQCCSSPSGLQSSVPSAIPPTMGTPEDLPTNNQRYRRRAPWHDLFVLVGVAVFGLAVIGITVPRVDPSSTPFSSSQSHDHHNSHAQRAAAISRCKALREKPGPSPHFHDRKQSDRFVPGTKPTLLKNAKIWTGLDNGTEIVHGDILLDNGIIQSVGYIHPATLKKFQDELVTVDLKHAWVTPGCVLNHAYLVQVSGV